MCACKNSFLRFEQHLKRKEKEQEQRARVRQLENEVAKLEEVVRELQHRVTQLEIARKIGF